VLTWSSYSNRSAEWQKAAQSSLDKALQNEMGSSRLAALKKVASELADRDTICRVSPLVSWQSDMFPMLHARVASCVQMSAQVVTLRTHVDKLVAYLQDEQQFIDMISTPELKKPEVTEADFASQVTAWQSVTDTVKKMMVSADFSPVKEEATTRLGEATRVWKSLLSAHEAKDRAAYSEAAAHLSAAYQVIGDINTINDRQYRALLSNLQGVYRATFRV